MEKETVKVSAFCGEETFEHCCEEENQELMMEVSMPAPLEFCLSGLAPLEVYLTFFAPLEQWPAECEAWKGAK